MPYDEDLPTVDSQLAGGSCPYCGQPLGDALAAKDAEYTICADCGEDLPWHHCRGGDRAETEREERWRAQQESKL
jgi:hypothetical protein